MPGTLVPRAEMAAGCLVSCAMMPAYARWRRQWPNPFHYLSGIGSAGRWSRRDDHQLHYESEPQRSFTQWVKSQPVYDRLYVLYENSRLSSREIEPFIRKYQIDMAEVEPLRYRS